MPRPRQGLARGGPWLLAALAGVVVLASLGVSTAAFTGSTSNGGNSLVSAAVFPQPVFRVTTYELSNGAWTSSNTYTLTLKQDLEPNYFVIVEGASRNSATSDDANAGPNLSFARVDRDPFGNFGVSSAADEIRLQRGAGGVDADWKGQVTVVESLRDSTGAGFTLLGVDVATFTDQTSLSRAAPAWTDIDQVGLYGGPRGGGVQTTTANRARHQVGWARIFPQAGGGGTLEYRRQSGGGGSLAGSTTTFTTYVVEWGSDWTIQRATVSGTSGGDGVDGVGEYDTATIAAATRENTFVLANGHTSDNGLGDGWAGQVVTLGDGVSQATSESLVAVGSEYAGDSRTAEVYVHTHPDLRVGYWFGSDGGTPGIPATALTGAVSVDPPPSAESYDNAANPRTTGDWRMAVITSSSHGVGNAYPRPMVWSRHTAAGNVQWSRARLGQPGAFWLQSVDFTRVRA